MVEWRVTKDSTKIGFNSKGTNVENNTADDILELLTADDLLNYGFIPELVGRLPVTVGLSKLNLEALVKVLKDPKDALIKQYQALFKIDNVDLEFTPAALAVAAKRALERKIGARGLRSIMEETLLDVMYELPSASDVKRCIVYEKAIFGETPPRLETTRGTRIDIGKKSRNTA